MASIIKLQCPNCGAPLQAGPNDAQVVCSYCKHTSLLQRPNAPPVAQPPSPQFHTVTVQASGPSMAIPIIASLVMTLGIGGFVFFMVTKEVGGVLKDVVPGATDMMKELGASAGASKFQFSDHPQLSDLNGDGVPEIIGLTREPGGAQWIAAYDGKTLAPLWKTTPLEKDATDGSARRGVVPGLVLSADALGRLQAYADKTGQPAWAALIGERVTSFCLGEGFVRVLAADKKEHDLALDTGKRVEGSEKKECTPVQSLRTEDGPVYSLVSWSEFDDLGIPGLHDLDGLSAHRALVVRGTKRAFMLGGKSSGTRYPMVAAVEGKKVLWTDAVAGVDPMTSDTNVTTQLASFFGDKLAIPYAVRNNGGVRMALFDAVSGKRLWDMPIHQKSNVESGITMTADTIYYATWTGVYLIDVATGKTRAMLGMEF